MVFFNRSKQLKFNSGTSPMKFLHPLLFLIKANRTTRDTLLLSLFFYLENLEQMYFWTEDSHCPSCLAAVLQVTFSFSVHWTRALSYFMIFILLISVQYQPKQIKKKFKKAEYLEDGAGLENLSAQLFSCCSECWTRKYSCFTSMHR